MNTVSSLLILSCLAFADDPKSSALIQTLPPDGSWVTHQVTIDVDGRELKPTWTVRSVGKIDYDGKPCRFIELEQTCETPVAPIFGLVTIGNQCWRLLIPEAEFGAGKHPFGHAVKVWEQTEKEETAALSSIAVKDPILDAILRGPGANLKVETDTEKVAWQRGNLICEIFSGINETEFAGAKVRLEHRVLRHKDVPFGVAGMRQRITASFGDEKYPAAVQMTLRDYGENAKPKFPQLVP